MIRYYGYYSNKSRGLRKKAGMDDAVPALIDAKMAPKEFRKNWARLIQKIYQPDNNTFTAAVSQILHHMTCSIE